MNLANILCSAIFGTFGCKLNYTDASRAVKPTSHIILKRSQIGLTDKFLAANIPCGELRYIGLESMTNQVTVVDNRPQTNVTLQWEGGFKFTASDEYDHQIIVDAPPTKAEWGI